ncbi:carbohydrate-binding protein [Psychromonas sp. psych-6C06]|uniref:carbohydrate-binding protein n=1 Tax=Psychromonas sp. psych-6C06 TaxID=2058089 RepID=UPI00187C84EA|nr:carbohydrate-binding protein [Psychromonas sp. psych-6C06]
MTPKVFISDPNTNQIFVGVAGSEVVPVNLANLTLGEAINIGGIPAGMALSRDQRLLYISLSNRPALAVIDINNWQLQDEIRITRPGDQVAVDWKDRIYIGSMDRNEDIMVYDADKGGVTEPIPYHCSICYRPLLQMSADGKTLFGANRGISAATLASYDVSGEVPVKLTSRSDLGSNGQDLHLSNDNQHLYFAVGGGNGTGYDVAQIDIQTNTVEGYMEIGAYPRELTTSPDGTYFYAVHTSGHIDAWNANTLVQITQYPVVGEAFDLMTDLSGNYLIAAFSNALRIIEAEGTLVVVDEDSDGISDTIDNCLDIYNPEQLDSDSDSLGNACDQFPLESNHKYAQCAVELELSQSRFSQVSTDLATCQINAQDKAIQIEALLLEQVALNARITELEQILGTVTPTPVITPTPTITPTPVIGDSNWSASTVYNKGDTVTVNGITYVAGWWTKGQEPGTTGEWGVWKIVK